MSNRINQNYYCDSFVEDFDALVSDAMESPEYSVMLFKRESLELLKRTRLADCGADVISLCDQLVELVWNIDHSLKLVDTE